MQMHLQDLQEDLPLVGEIAVESANADARGRSDVGGLSAVEPLGREHLESRLDQALVGAARPILRKLADRDGERVDGFINSG